MNLTKGLVAGAVAGAAAGIAMQVFDDVWQRKYDTPSYETDITRSIAMTVAQRLGLELSDGRLDAAARGVHFAIAIALGAAYGLAVEAEDNTAIAAGIPFFVGEAVLGNELIGPKLGLFRPARDYPMNKHWNSVLSHIVFGAVAELARREVRQRL